MLSRQHHRKKLRNFRFNETIICSENINLKRKSLRLLQQFEPFVPRSNLDISLRLLRWIYLRVKGSSPGKNLTQRSFRNSSFRQWRSSLHCVEKKTKKVRRRSIWRSWASWRCFRSQWGLSKQFKTTLKKTAQNVILHPTAADYSFQLFNLLSV